MAGSKNPILERKSCGIDHNDKCTQKNKGGRKLIYATQEERKQRNREAQAALRERRTDRIKELEKKIDMLKDEVAKMQTLSSTLTDRYLMLRYKNSLLERILLEKGVDVQEELNMKLNPHQIERSEEKKKRHKPQSNAQQVPRPTETTQAMSKPSPCCKCSSNCETDRHVAFESPSGSKPDQSLSTTTMASPPQFDAVQPILFPNKRRRYLSSNSAAAHARKCTSSAQNPVAHQFSKHSTSLGKFSPSYITHLYYGALAVLD